LKFEEKDSRNAIVLIYTLHKIFSTSFENLNCSRLLAGFPEKKCKTEAIGFS